MDLKLKDIKKYIKSDHVTDVNFNGTKLVHYLTQFNRLDLIKKLHIESFDVSDEDGNNPMHIASKLNYHKLFDYFSKIDPLSLYDQNNNGCSVVWYLSMDKDRLIKMIKNNELDISQPIKDDLTLMHLYVQKSDIKMIEFLIKNGYDPNHPVKNPPLMMAVVLNSDSVVKTLLENGADPNISDKKMYKPLLLAILNDFESIFDLLLNYGSDVNYYGPENMEHPVIVALHRANYSILKKLLDKKIDMNIQNKYLETPIHYMYYMNIHRKVPLELKRQMIQNISSINTKDGDGNTILCFIAFLDKWEDFEDILKNFKLKIHEKNKEGVKPLDGIKNKEKFILMTAESYINQLKRTDKIWTDELDLRIIQNNYKISDELIERITKEESHPKSSKDKVMFKLPIYPPTITNRFNATTFEEALYTICILKSNPEIKIPKYMGHQSNESIMKKIVNLVDSEHSLAESQLSYIGDHLQKSRHFVPYIVTWLNENSFVITEDLVKGTKYMLTKYPSTKLIFYKLSIVISERVTHANLLIYDIQRKFVERFDPYGNVSHSSEIMDEVFKKYFFDHLGVKYYSPRDTVKGISFQVFGDENNSSNRLKGDPGGFCLAWAMWYLELRLLNLHLNPKKLIKMAVQHLNKLDMKFIDYIRNYANHLDLRKNKLLELAGIPKEEWYRSYMSDKNYDAYLNMIEFELEKLL